MKMVSDFVSNMLPETTLNDFCQQITALFSQVIAAAKANINMMKPEQRPAASAAVYSRHQQQVWLIGDCQCMADGVLYENDKPAEAVNAAKRSRFIHQLFKERNENYAQESNLTKELQVHDIGRDYIIEDIVKSMQGANSTYAVIDGTPIYKKGVRVIDVSNVHELVLATDGYPFLKSTLKDSEKALATLLYNDPLCVNEYIATKGMMKGYQSFDDRTYIRFRL